MSEYITETVVFNFDGEPGGDVKHASIDVTVKEEIVRCRDCKHFNGWACAASSCSYCGEPQRVEPDGFCAWGERSDASKKHYDIHILDEYEIMCGGEGE